MEFVLLQHLLGFGNFVRIDFSFEVLDGLVLADESVFFLLVQAVAVSDGYAMQVLCVLIVLSVSLMVVLVHVSSMNGILWFSGHFVLCFANMWIINWGIKLVGVVAMSRNVLLGWIDQREPLHQMVRNLLARKTLHRDWALGEKSHGRQIHAE